jgi:hypothetical protein
MTNQNLDKIIDIIHNNNNIRNLIKLYNDSNDKRKNIYKEKLIKEIEQIKKKKIIESSKKLSNLARLYNSNDNIHNIYKSLENNLITIDNFSDYINDSESVTELTLAINKLNPINDKYIECYSN